MRQAPASAYSKSSANQTKQKPPLTKNSNPNHRDDIILMRSSLEHKDKMSLATMCTETNAGNHGELITIN